MPQDKATYSSGERATIEGQAKHNSKSKGTDVKQEPRKDDKTMTGGFK